MRVEKTDEYKAWIDDLKDQAGRARILMRVDRLIHGNPGTHRDLTEGVSELKIDVGPGYRVYYSIRRTQLLLLLVGGNKSTQQKDIQLALSLNRSFEEQPDAKSSVKKQPKNEGDAL
jgi:putative addiction module killer protein